MEEEETVSICCVYICVCVYTQREKSIKENLK